MEFYRLVRYDDRYQLEEEQGQPNIGLDNGFFSRAAEWLYQYHECQTNAPLRFRKYLTAYYTTGEMEYIALADARYLEAKPLLDGFATTWLGGEGENRVWLGADGVIENRGSSTKLVKDILQLLVQDLQGA